MEEISEIYDSLKEREYIRTVSLKGTLRRLGKGQKGSDEREF